MGGGGGGAGVRGGEEPRLVGGEGVVGEGVVAVELVCKGEYFKELFACLIIN